jgi:hypothetical protein
MLYKSKARIVFSSAIVEPGGDVPANTSEEVIANLIERNLIVDASGGEEPVKNNSSLGYSPVSINFSKTP